VGWVNINLDDPNQSELTLDDLQRKDKKPADNLWLVFHQPFILPEFILTHCRVAIANYTSIDLVLDSL
jgi:hypothetical protein